MGQVLHGSATTTEAIRRAFQHGQERLSALARRYGVNQKAVAKGRNRSAVADLPTGPREPKLVLSRFHAAQGARSGHLALECQGAFPAQC